MEKCKYMDNHFFRSYFPYKIEIKSDKETIEFFNRYYNPRGKYTLGYSEWSKLGKRYAVPNKKNIDYSILKALANQGTDSLREHENGSIEIWLYNDSTNPITGEGFNDKLLKTYLDKIEVLMKFMRGFTLVEF